MTGLNDSGEAQPHARGARRARQFTYSSSTRENAFEHLLLAQIGTELLARDVEYDELHSSVDKDGSDVLLEAGKTQRHIQLKVMIRGGKRTDVTVHTRLAARPSGCVVWLTYDPATRDFCDIRWFGAASNEPLPDLGDKVARHSRGNSQGVKAERPDHRVVAARRFERLDNIGHLVDRLFGRLPDDPLAFLCSRLRPEAAPQSGWLKRVASGDLTAIPADLVWGDEAIQLAHLLNGYHLLELLDVSDPAAFLDCQREAQRTVPMTPAPRGRLASTFSADSCARRWSRWRRPMRRVALAAFLLTTLPGAPVLQARKALKPVWQVTRTSDAITGATSCIIAAYDRAAGLSFSRTGALYPFVENNSVHGVLVGVSSGGRVRVPTGDIVWRVDDRPFRTLAAADNPAGMSGSAIPLGTPGMQELVDQQMRLIAAATATSTVASGGTARAILSEMLAGKGLVFRAAAATAGYGLPTGAERNVGQITRDGLRPYPLDESFRAGLATCGIPAAGSVE
jgi:hypothetical protein